MQRLVPLFLFFLKAGAFRLVAFLRAVAVYAYALRLADIRVVVHAFMRVAVYGGLRRGIGGEVRDGIGKGAAVVAEAEAAGLALGGGVHALHLDVSKRAKAVVIVDAVFRGTF